MAVHPHSPILNNAENNNADRAPQGLPTPLGAPNPNNGVMAAPNFPRQGGGFQGPFGRNLGLGPRQMFNPQQQHPQIHHPLAPRAPPANHLHLDVDEEEHDDVGPILIKIHCPVLIKGDNNVCSVDPAILTQRITIAVAEGLRTMGGGVPMINENGTPREIRVEVQAETRIEGSQNLVGEKHDHLVVKAEADEIVQVENGEAHARARAFANGHARGGSKRKIAQREEQDVASGGLHIKLEPLNNGDDDGDDDDDSDVLDRSLKRLRRK